MNELTDRGGDLFLGESILLVRYPEGDCDSCPWPMTTQKQRENLASALYGEYECGFLTSRNVKLPDGTMFNIDENVK